jgi:hypothetical protein
MTEFHKFWWIYISVGVYQKKEARYQGRQGKKHIPPRNQVEKDLEDMRRWPLEGGPPGIGPGRLTLPQVGWPVGSPVSLPLLRRFLHRLMVCIFAVDSSQFDSRAMVHPTGLYKQGPAPWLRHNNPSHLIKSSELETLVSLELHQF